MGAALMQAINEIGVLKFIGAILIAVFFFYGMFGVKHNKPKESKSSGSSNSTPTSGGE